MIMPADMQPAIEYQWNESRSQYETEACRQLTDQLNQVVEAIRNDSMELKTPKMPSSRRKVLNDHLRQLEQRRADLQLQIKRHPPALMSATRTMERLRSWTSSMEEQFLRVVVTEKQNLTKALDGDDYGSCNNLLQRMHSDMQDLPLALYRLQTVRSLVDFTRECSTLLAFLRKLTEWEDWNLSRLLEKVSDNQTSSQPMRNALDLLEQQAISDVLREIRRNSRIFFIRQMLTEGRILLDEEVAAEEA
jgi:hypothetical protein